MAAVRAPAGLSGAGKALWRQVTEVYGLGPAEVPLLIEACKVADRIAQLDRELADAPVAAVGSRGQRTEDPLRKARRDESLLLAKHLGQLGFPDADGQMSQSQWASHRGRRAASARWAKRVG